tara:strand:+ start:14 stop:2029 length:2016 start_codon:yes stop_codon:yes gene_type:complete
MDSIIKSVRVTDIIMDSSHPMFNSKGEYESIGLISYETLGVFTSGRRPPNWLQGVNVAKPLFSFTKSYPLLNEVVLIIEAADDSIYKTGGSTTYYLPNLNVWNHPHHNALPSLNNFRNNIPTLNDYIEVEGNLVRRIEDEGTDITLGDYFKENTKIKPLISYEGDNILEGRFGNSIRLGSTNLNHPKINLQNQWSGTGSFGDPIIVIRNGQYEKENLSEENKGWIPISEKINEDHSSIYLTSTQQIKSFKVASLHKTSYGEEKSQTPWIKKLMDPYLNKSKSPNIKKQPFINIKEDPYLIIPTNTKDIKFEEITKIKLNNSYIIELETDNQIISDTDTIVLNELTTPPETNNPSGSSDLGGGLNQEIGNYYKLKHLIYSKEFCGTAPLEELIDEDNRQANIKIGIKNPKNNIEENLTGIITAELSSINEFLINTEKKAYAIKGELKGFPDEITIESNLITSIDEFKDNKPYTLSKLKEKVINELYSQGNDIFKVYYNKSDKNEMYDIDLENRIITEGGTINNYPGIDTYPTTDEIINNLKAVMINCIDKIKVAFPDLIITSAYRSNKLNNSIGGSPSNSEHIKGQAIDIKSKNAPTSKIFNWCCENLPEWNNLLWAYPERENESWIHISYINENNKKYKTIATEREDIHEKYNGLRRGNFQEIKLAEENYI